ncbi:hypothetical protein BH11ARM1_BH11ARM1_04790 [soil metagenome]
MRLTQKQRHRRIREAEIAAWQSTYNTERDPGLREAYTSLPRSPIELLCNPLVKDVNQGGMLRLAEAFRIQNVIFSPEHDQAKDYAGNRGTDIWQPHEFLPIEDAVPKAKSEGKFLVALTISERAQPIQEIDWKFPLAIIIGEERFGVPKSIEEQCDAVAAIPIFGIVQSMNVTTATAIALYEATNAYRKFNPAFEPARTISRNLLGLADTNYLVEENGRTWPNERP